MPLTRRDAAAARKLLERSAAARAAVKRLQRTREQQVRDVYREERRRGGSDPRVIRP